MWMSAAAAVSGVALVSWVGLDLMQPAANTRLQRSPAGPVQAQSLAEPAARSVGRHGATGGSAPLRAYLVAHHGYSPTGSMQGVALYARGVSDISDQRTLMIFRAVCLAAALDRAARSTWAQGQSEALGMLSRAVTASEKTSYAGTFVYQSGTNVETSHIAHHVDAAGNSIERLEVLDGSPREVVRVNDEVRCYLPKEKVVIEDRRGSRKTFPSLLPEAVGSLADFYSRSSSARRAGLPASRHIPCCSSRRTGSVIGYMFWIEARSGLLLKARMVNERGEPIEQFAFAQLKIGEPLSDERCALALAVHVRPAGRCIRPARRPGRTWMSAGS
jgi:negative regulator of sigma E activity